MEIERHGRVLPGRFFDRGIRSIADKYHRGRVSLRPIVRSDIRERGRFRSDSIQLRFRKLIRPTRPMVIGFKDYTYVGESLKNRTTDTPNAANA